ncbi:MAG: LOG family protein [Methylotetracoccus sp.]|nr:LOG family protein [Methylotetracoccus sp.]
MADLSDGFIALPGGYGTLEEFFEIVTWAQLGLHRKPCGLLNVRGYFDPLLRLVDQAVGEGFVRTEHRLLIIDDQDPEALMDRMLTYTAPETPQILHPDEI